MTAHELIKVATDARPEVKYVTNDKQNTIGAWSEALGRYVIVAGLMLGKPGEWVSLPYELLVNGKPLEINWIV